MHTCTCVFQYFFSIDNEDIQKKYVELKLFEFGDKCDILLFYWVFIFEFGARSLNENAFQLLRIFFPLVYYCAVPVGTFINCARRPCFRASARGIGYSFQLAITTPRMNLIGYGTATAQS